MQSLHNQLVVRVFTATQIWTKTMNIYMLIVKTWIEPTTHGVQTTALPAELHPPHHQTTKWLKVGIKKKKQKKNTQLPDMNDGVYLRRWN